MIKILKYVINENKIPILFNKNITHSEILLNVISAGFLIVSFDEIHGAFSVKCFGESSSLAVGVAEEDSDLIEHFLNTQLYSIKRTTKFFKADE